MDMTRVFGLDSYEWTVTLTGSAMLALVFWAM